MITATVGDLLDDELDDIVTKHVRPPGSTATDWLAKKPRLYVVRDGSLVFYVGQSQDVADRLLAHLGKGTWSWGQGPSGLGYLILRNLPESRDWQIELLTPDDCGVAGTVVEGVTKAEFDATELLSQVFSWNESWERGGLYFSQHDIDIAEKRLIAKHKPCLNVTYNNNPTPLPQHLELDLNLETTISDFIPF